MQQIAVTHGFMKKLARNIRDRYGRDVRHTEVIELVANALGYKAGPLMHALKSEAAEITSTDVERHQVPTFLIDRWEVATRPYDLTQAQKKVVVLVRADGAPTLLLVASGFENHPDAATARMHLRRKGYSWSEEPSVEPSVVALAYEQSASSLAPSRPGGLSTQTATVSAVGNVLRAIRDKDIQSLYCFVPLLAPTTAVAKFALAYAHRLRTGGDTRTTMALLLDAFVEEPFFVELAATSVVANAMSVEAFERFERSFDYGQTLHAEILAGSLFPRIMLAWAANHAVAHGFLEFDGDRAVVKVPPLLPKAYGYKLKTPDWILNDDGRVSDGRGAFLLHICKREADGLAQMMDHDWTSPDELDVAAALIRVCARFANEAVVGGAWTSERVVEYAGKALPRLLAERYDKPY